MIITQTHKRRTFVGSMNVGSDLVQALTSICVDNSIFCAELRAVGYLKDVQVRTFDPVGRRYTDPETIPGVVHATSLRGNISLEERQTVVRCHLLGTTVPERNPTKVVSGELLAGSVINIEFTLDTLDDIRLYRSADEKTGLDPWLHIEFGAGPPPARDDKRIAIAPDAPAVAAAAPAPRRPEPERSPLPDQELEFSEGDLLHHPTLGRCEVVGGDGEERLTIRLESGRCVEIHLRLLELTPIEPDGKRRVYKVAIRRRR